MEICFKNSLSQKSLLGAVVEFLTAMYVPFKFMSFFISDIKLFVYSQMFSIAYLALFSIALMMPACGSVVLNSIVFVWTLTIWVELTRRTFVKKRVGGTLLLKLNFSLRNTFYDYVCE